MAQLTNRRRNAKVNSESSNMQNTIDQGKAFDFASGITKLLISLATGVITITITFGSNYLTKLDSIKEPCCLFCSWIFLAFSIAFGIFALMAMTGVLSKEEHPNVYSCNVRILEIFQIFFFLTGITLAIKFTYSNIVNNKTTQKNTIDMIEGQLRHSYKGRCNTIQSDTLVLNATISEENIVTNKNKKIQK